MLRNDSLVKQKGAGGHFALSKDMRNPSTDKKGHVSLHFGCRFLRLAGALVLGPSMVLNIPFSSSLTKVPEGLLAHSNGLQEMLPLASQKLLLMPH